jgi:alkylation response protein AidB-like acyl-CoA dehydrogenase
MGDSKLFPCPREWTGDLESSLAETLERWAESELMAKRLELKESYSELLEPAMKKLFLEIGLQRLLWPEEHGGDGHNQPAAALTAASALEQVARGDVGIAFALACLFSLQQLVAMEGRIKEEACRELAPLITSKENLSLVAPLLPLFRERPQAVARESRGGFTVEAEAARPLAFGGNSSLFAVMCSLEGSEHSVGLVVVPADAKGVERGEMVKRTGLAADLHCPVTFSKVRVPGALAVALGPEECRSFIAWLCLGVSACCVGAMFAAFEILREWGDNRVIKGRDNIFKENPLTASVMAEVAKETSLSRILTWHLARVLSLPEVYGPAGSEENHVNALMIAHQVAQSAERATHQAMEMMASAGYAKEWQLERYWRDVKTVQLALGPYELAKMDVSRRFYQATTL